MAVVGIRTTFVSVLGLPATLRVEKIGGNRDGQARQMDLTVDERQRLEEFLTGLIDGRLGPEEATS